MLEKINDTQSPDAVFENESNDSFSWTESHDALSCESLRRLREASLMEIAALDKEAEKGMLFFFSNQVLDAEKLLGRRATVDPLCALGAACISSVKAMLSLDENDIMVAFEKIAFTISFAQRLFCTGNGLLHRVGNMLRGRSNEKRLLPGEFRAKAILAVAHTVQGLLLLLEQNSINNILKGGLALKKGYSLLNSLVAELDEVKKERQVNSYNDLGFDCNSVYVVLFGHGCTNIVMSILPSRVLRLLDFLGFSHNREFGMDLVMKSWKSKTILSPLAGIFLISINTLLSGFCPMLVSSSLSFLRKMAEEEMIQPPMNESLLHMWLLGRIYRLEMRSDESVNILSKCVDVASKGQISDHMSQLCDFVLYDQAWNYASASRWKDCILNYAHLEKNSAWLKIFYAYAQACCYEMLEYEVRHENLQMALKYKEEATAAYWRAAHYNIKMMGGRKSSIECLIRHRLNEIFFQSNVTHPNPENKKGIPLLTPLPPNNAVLQNTIMMPMLELLILFDIMHQIPNFFLCMLLQKIDQELEMFNLCNSPIPHGNLDCENNISYFANMHEQEKNQVVVLMTYKAIVLSNMKDRREEGRKFIEHTLHIARHYKGRDCTLSWMAPWLLHEEVCQLFMDGAYKESKKVLEQIESINAQQIFRTVMETKVSLAKYALRDATAEI